MSPDMTPAAVVAEAGSREAPPLPPGLLTADIGEVPGRPTKLFIGGISRHTTTKQLRDHFSLFGRVLDCVAMRQPDGRPRGFGYVTLDSPTAAERCLREPQMIDNRIVDMKLAVPEGSGGSGSTSPKEACFNMHMFAGQDYNMGMYTGQGFNGWPEAAGNFSNAMPWWSNAKASPQGQGLDCVDLLSAAREIAMSQTSSPHGLPLHSVSLQDYAEFDPESPEGAFFPAHPGDTLIPPEFQQPAGAFGKMSASAPEFVPLGAQAAPQKAVPNTVEASSPQARKAGQHATRTRPPLGELTNNVTNIVEVDAADLLKPFKSPSNKLADIGQGHLSAPNGQSDLVRPTGLLLDDEEVHTSSPSSGSDSAFSPDSAERAEVEVNAKAEDTVDESGQKSLKASNDGGDKGLEDGKEPVSSTESDSESGADGESGAEDVVVDLDALPSIGSAQHATGECKRCNFYPKGRCQNGKNCSFCHYPHDKRKPSRQEKRERRAAWLEQQGEEAGLGATFTGEASAALLGCQQEVMQHFSGPLLTQQRLQQGCFPGYPEEEVYSDETLAYSIFPGLPPFHATKLPAPLPLPGMDMIDKYGPAVPPGLAPPARPEAESSPASFLCTGQSLPAMVSSTGLSSAFLSTVPTPLRTPASTAASTPLPTPMATPTAAMTQARSIMPVAASTVTSETQTGDYMCRQCEVELKADTAEDISTEAQGGSAKQGSQWAREDLLRLRDGLARILLNSETGSSTIPYNLRTMAITAIPSI